PGKPGNAIFVLEGSNIVLRGRGIIDGSLCPWHTRSAVYVQGNNIRVEGVVLRDSSTWTMPIKKSDQLDVQNLKIFGWRGNSDGIDICNSHHVTVSDSFIRTYDDLVVVKADKGQGTVSDIDVRHCVLWNELAHALSLGAELREPISNVHFSDCDIIHDKGREWLLRVYNCDSAHVSDVTWDNIRIEEAQRLMSVWIGQAIWSEEAERGHIADITFRNITSVAPELPDSTAVLTGFDAAHAIAGVRFDHVIVGGKALAPTDVKQNAFVSGVTVTP
ncbi:MAG TPA: glycosyl hydrolase family 28 protein, partial [Candidatus Methylacidiphilales bacterium]|nr:glycosyl hydrolase family 28 protein [Candidatus Methylacidiphilales bacterium]